MFRILAKYSLELVLWIILTFVLLYFIFDPHAPFFPQFIVTLAITALTTIPSSLTSKILVPRLLYTKQIGKFVGAILILAIVYTTLTYVLAGGLYYELSGKSIFREPVTIIFIYSFILIINIIVIITGSAVRIITDRFGMEEELHEVAKEKVITELAFLRAQINPHFLFNILNTIYFQINKENREARSSLEKLSEMLRYQLYECTSDRIEISRELAYIENYVAVQRLRMEPGTDLRLHLPDKTASFSIAPLIILPLVENAFKHLSNHRDPSRNKLYITISLEPASIFRVNILNSYHLPDRTNELVRSGGLGLINLERRLTLLYPGKHSISSKRNENTYETTLTIQYD